MLEDLNTALKAPTNKTMIGEMENVAKKAVDDARMSGSFSFSKANALPEVFLKPETIATRIRLRPQKNNATESVGRTCSV